MNKLRYTLTLFLLVSFVASAQPKGLRILYIGDSITDGNWGGGNNPSEKRNHGDWNHLYGSGYMYLCVAHFMGYYPEKEFQFFNRGISGNTLQDLENRWIKDALELQPDVLSVLVGINDINKYLKSEQTFFDFEEWESIFRNLLQQTKDQNPDIKIVLGTPFVGKSGSFLKERQEEYRKLVDRCSEVIRKLANEYQAVLLEYQQLFDTLQTQHPDTPSEYWLWDGIHPTPAGHKHMAGLWIEEAGSLLIQK